LLVIVLIPAIAFGVVYFLGDRFGTSAGPTNSPNSGSQESSTPPPSDPPSEDPVISQEPEPDPTTEAPPAIDKTLKVTVYNAGETSGAAGVAADKLVTAGYASAAKAFPPNPANPAAATVYYATEAQAATAADIATVLGIATVEANPQIAATGIVVIVR
jgi:hypothetical protein